MMNQTNLALKLEPQEGLLSEAANAASIAQLLRPNTRRDPLVEAVLHAQKKRAFKPAVFSDKFSGDFRAFRVY